MREGGELRSRRERQGVVAVDEKSRALGLDIPAELLFKGYELLFAFVIGPEKDLRAFSGDDLLRFCAKATLIALSKEAVTGIATMETIISTARIGVRIFQTRPVFFIKSSFTSSFKKGPDDSGPFSLCCTITQPWRRCCRQRSSFQRRWQSRPARMRPSPPRRGP